MGGPSGRILWLVDTSYQGLHMTGKSKCPECGTELPSGSPEGLCPACLMKMGLRADQTLDPTTLPGGSDFNPPEQIGPYKILQPLGEGGMGIVYQAEQEAPIRRRVALKLIKVGMDSKEVIARFESERQALALMDHPHIAKVFDAGTTEQGRPYFVMELVQGIPITRYCDDQRLTPKERLDLFIPVCRALHHAHQRGIIHRDIKPSNVLVTVQDGKAVPKVIDFGVAKAVHQRLTEKTLFTQQGLLIGTPEYMSPEQADLTGLDVDTTTDVYSLGVLLYELLTGALPFEAERLRQAGYAEMQRIIREEDPAKPSTKISSLGATATEVGEHRNATPAVLERWLRGDLDWVTLKALEKDRTRRYQAATELAADLERYLQHEPVVASPPDIRYRLRKFIRRNRLWVSAATTVALVIVLGVVAVLIQAERTEQERKQRTAQLVDASVMTGMKLTEEGEHLNALPWLMQAFKLEEGGEEREHVHRVRLASVLDDLPKLIQVWFHDGEVTWVEFSSDGNQVLSASRDGTARVWDVATGKEVLQVEHPDAVQQVRFSSSGRIFATACEDQSVRVWNARTGGQVTDPIEHSAILTHLEISPDERFLASASKDGSLLISDLETGGILHRVTLLHTETEGDTHAVEPSALVMDPASRFVVISTRRGRVRAIELSSGKDRFPPIQVDVMGGSPVALSSDGQLLAIGEWRFVRFWDTTSGKESEEPILRAGNRSLAFGIFGPSPALFSGGKDVRVLSTLPLRMQGPSGPRHVNKGWRSVLQNPIALDMPAWRLEAASGRTDRLLVLSASAQVFDMWATHRSKVLTPKLVHSGSASSSASLSEDGRLVATGGVDHSIRVWSIREEYPPTYPLRVSHSHDADYSADGRRLIVSSSPDATRMGCAQVWDAVENEPVSPRFYHYGWVRWVQLSDDGSRAMTSGEYTQTWDVETGEPLTGPLKLSQPTAIGILSGNGRWVAAHNFGEWAIWDVDKTDATPALSGKDRLGDLAFTPDSRQVLIAGEGGVLEVYSLEKTEKVLPPISHGAPIGFVQTSPDGSVIATRGQDQKIRFWSAHNGSEQRSPILLPGDRLRAEAGSPAKTFSFHPDGRRFVTLANSIEARMWNLDLSRPYTRGLVHGGLVTSLDFSRDGRWLLSADQDSYVRIWDAASGHPVSPPLYFPRGIVWDAEPSADGLKFLVAAARGAYERRIRAESIPAEDLSLEVLMLSGQTLLGTGEIVITPPETLSAAWSFLSEKYPGRYQLEAQDQATRLRSEADYYIRTDRVGEAVENLDTLLVSPVARSRDFELRGDLHAGLGRWRKAVADYERASQRRPGNAKILGRLALLRFQSGEEGVYRDLCSSIVERFVDSRNTDIALQVAYHCVGRQVFSGFEEATLSQANSLLEVFGSESPEAWEYLALAYLLQIRRSQGCSGGRQTAPQASSVSLRLCIGSDGPPRHGGAWASPGPARPS